MPEFRDAGDRASSTPRNGRVSRRAPLVRTPDAGPAGRPAAQARYSRRSRVAAADLAVFPPAPDGPGEASAESALRELLVVEVPPSRELARWKYGWARGWPEVFSYPSRPKPVPSAEGRAVITSTSFYRVKTTVRSETTKDGAPRGEHTYENVPEERLTNKWQLRHTKRRAVCELLRRAAWYVRRHWARDGETWTTDTSDNGWTGRDAPEGEQFHEESGSSCPVIGLAVVDPLDVFNQVNECCSDAALRPTTGGIHGNVGVYVRRCKRHKFCAVCGHQDAEKRGNRVTVVAARTAERTGPAPGYLQKRGAILHMALTHRDAPPGAETCVEAHDRWEGGWQRLRTGENGAWFASMVYGFVLNIETTNGKTGRSWHPHGHFILELREGVDAATFRDELAARWARCTTLAAIAAGLSKRYLDEVVERLAAVKVEGEQLRAAGEPRTGLQTLAAQRVARDLAVRAVEGECGWGRESGWKDGREQWCEPLGETDEEVRRACLEASKYPNAQLGVETPARLAEWMQWAEGRRLCRWGGAWDDKTVQEWIDAVLELEAEVYQEEQERLGNRPQIGKLIRGSQRTVTTTQAEQARAASGMLHFDGLGVWREVQDVDGVRGWWSMYGEHRMAVGKITEQITGRDDPRKGDEKHLRELLEHVRRMPLHEAKPLWERMRVELEARGPLGFPGLDYWCPEPPEGFVTPSSSEPGAHHETDEDTGPIW